MNKTPAKTASKKSVASKPAAAAKRPAKPSAAGRSGVKPAVKPASKPKPKAAAKPTKAVAKPSAKPSAKATARAPAKVPSKPSAKPALKKPAAKPPTKPAARPAAKLPVKPHSPVPKTKTPPESVKVADKPVAKTAPPPAPKPSPVVAMPSSASLIPDLVPSKRTGRAAAARAMAPMVQAPLPAPTSRFADRFAPPRPPTRQMNNVELDTPRHAHKSDPKLANAWKTKAGKDLTEAEVLAMPESEYMNDKQLEFFRGKLQQLKDDLLSNAGETTEHLREDTSIVPDPADRATIEEEHALELRTRDRERKLLKKISQSLGRIEAGDYGFCDETGEPIGLGRLIARPTATLSLEAQQRRELKQKMFGD